LPNQVKSGSFFYDAKLNLGSWKPNRDDFRCMSIAALKLFAQNLKFERLRVKQELAEEMFKYNK
jgi:hypothetical protein